LTRSAGATIRSRRVSLGYHKLTVVKNLMASKPAAPATPEQRPRVHIVAALVLVCFAASYMLIRDALKSPVEPRQLAAEAKQVAVGSRVSSSERPADVLPEQSVNRPTVPAGASVSIESLVILETGTYSISESSLAIESSAPTQTIVPVPASARSVGLAAGFSEINGRVTLNGTPPPERTIPLDPSCGRLHADTLKTRFYVHSSAAGLADVLVYIKEGLGKQQFGPAAEPVTLNQQGCQFVPYVLGLQVGQRLLVSNSDPLLHNVHIGPTMAGNPNVNKAQPQHSKPLEFVLNNPELFLRFRCDVHNWMFAYVCVMPHPFFAISDSEGSYRLSKLPPGKYIISAIHRKAGEQTREVNLREGERFEINFVFKPSDTGADGS
jgi:hypothetical protein